MDRYLRLKDASKFSRVAAAGVHAWPGRCVTWSKWVMRGQHNNKPRMPDSSPDAPPPLLLWFPVRLSSPYRLLFTPEKV